MFIAVLDVYCDCLILISLCFGFRYLLGESVDGMAIVLFGVLHNGQKKSIQRSLQNVPVSKYLKCLLNFCPLLDGKFISSSRCLTFAFSLANTNMNKNYPQS